MTIKILFQLCKDKKWIEKLTIPVGPNDCGVNSGLTFR